MPSGNKFERIKEEHMKTLVLAVAVLALLGGCAMVSYQSADGTSVSYSRLFTTADSLKVKVGDATAEVNGQRIDAATLGALLNVLGSAAK
jgi:hypothetical protein